MATHSSILAWKIPSTEELGGLQSMGLQKVWHNWVTKHVRAHTHTHVYICTQTPIFFICSYVDGHLGYFHFLASINSAAMNIGVHISFQISVLILSSYIPRSEIAGLYDSSIFRYFEETSCYFWQWLYQFTFLLTLYKGPLFTISLPTFVIGRFFEDSHSNRCEWSLLIWFLFL